MFSKRKPKLPSVFQQIVDLDREQDINMNKKVINIKEHKNISSLRAKRRRLVKVAQDFLRPDNLK